MNDVSTNTKPDFAKAQRNPPTLLPLKVSDSAQRDFRVPSYQNSSFVINNPVAFRVIEWQILASLHRYVCLMCDWEICWVGTELAHILASPHFVFCIASCWRSLQPGHLVILKPAAALQRIHFQLTLQILENDFAVTGRQCVPAVAGVMCFSADQHHGAEVCHDAAPENSVRCA